MGGNGSEFLYNLYFSNIWKEIICLNRFFHIENIK